MHHFCCVLQPLHRAPTEERVETTQYCRHGVASRLSTLPCKACLPERIPSVGNVVDAASRESRKSCGLAAYQLHDSFPATHSDFQIDASVSGLSAPKFRHHRDAGRMRNATLEIRSSTGVPSLRVHCDHDVKDCAGACGCGLVASLTGRQFASCWSRCRSLGEIVDGHSDVRSNL